MNNLKAEMREKMKKVNNTKKQYQSSQKCFRLGEQHAVSVTTSCGK